MAVSYSGMDPAIRLLRDLVAINSVNPTLVPGAPGEQQIADAIAIEMRRIGLDVTVEAAAPGRPNVVGVLEGRSKGRAMMFCGHTDTVGVAGMSDPFNPLDRALQARPPHALLGTGSLHASFIEGGRELSSYPDRATLQMERRTLPHDPGTQAYDEVQHIVRCLVDEDPTFRATARPLFSRPAYEIAARHELPTLLATAIQTVSGGRHDGGTCGASFWADSAVLGHAEIPSVLFGPGGAGLHSTEEYVNVADVVVCRDALAEVVKCFCEGSRPGRT